jgi:uncharacterized protein YbjQ (UPF0145 family)
MARREDDTPQSEAPIEGPAGPETSDAESEREQELSQQRIEQGGIPLAAERRMQAIGAGKLPFSSTLSVSEFALTSKLQMQPVGQVLGASVHQVGWQFLPGASAWGGQVMCELDVVEQAWEQARRLALDRLTEEARQAGADAVVGVHVKHGTHDWAAGAVDYVVAGTAVRLPGSKGGGWPVLSDLSGQEYWQLYQAGYAPAGLVAATAAVFVSPGQGVQWQRWVTQYQNQELTDFTQGFYSAREIALRKLSSQADSCGADGIVGVRIDQHAGLGDLRVERYGRSVGPGFGGFGGLNRGYGGASGSQDERHGLVITLQAMGTAIRTTESVTPYPPEPAVNLTT